MVPFRSVLFTSEKNMCCVSHTSLEHSRNRPEWPWHVVQLLGGKFGSVLGELRIRRVGGSSSLCIVGYVGGIGGVVDFAKKATFNGCAQLTREHASVTITLEHLRMRCVQFA
jgi:hypothetical protein